MKPHDIINAIEQPPPSQQSTTTTTTNESNKVDDAAGGVQQADDERQQQWMTIDNLCQLLREYPEQKEVTIYCILSYCCC